MKRSIARYLAWGTMVASMSMLFFTMTAGPASAYTQNNNQWSNTGQGTGWCSGYGANGTDPNYPCMYWQEPYNTSVHLNFVVDTALGNVGGYDFTSLSHGRLTNGIAHPLGTPTWNGIRVNILMDIM